MLAIYEATAVFPTEERFGLTSQIRRAPVSISANIVEGSARGTDAEFRRFLYIAFGSATEVQYLLQLASELRFLESSRYDELRKQAEEVKRMLSTFIEKLRAESRKLRAES